MPKYIFAINKITTLYYHVMAEDQDAALETIKSGSITPESFGYIMDYKNALVRTEKYDENL